MLNGAPAEIVSEGLGGNVSKMPVKVQDAQAS